MKTKRCPKCGETKSVDEFHKHSETHDKLRVPCKQCRVQECKEYHAQPHVRMAHSIQGKQYRRRPEIHKRRQEYHKTPEIRAKNNARTTKRMQEFRQQIFDKLGHQCEWCGNIEDKMLTIDHKNNDGGEHRRKTKNAWKLYRDIIADPNAKKYLRILCMGCNWARRIYKNDRKARAAINRNIIRIRGIK